MDSTYEVYPKLREIDLGHDVNDVFFRGKGREIAVIDMFTYSCRYYKDSSLRVDLPDYAWDWQKAIGIPNEERTLENFIERSRMVFRGFGVAFSNFLKLRKQLKVTIVGDEQTEPGIIPINADGRLDRKMSEKIILEERSLFYR
ncbi:hypothetical protein L596_022622 [Steinernema carpocapsae]|uniref:Uncharacterized protein n=1 Tax=Steinernema carpocapsae TaxID=34508 RepID=A0A4U5MM69_STECR|nr:hypothetical protein L596_022622 [Steinernema carpocapsae]